jgi:hypothetical protein
VDQTSAQQRPEQMTPEESESRDYARLIELYGDNPVMMSALAKAWRLGFSRHMRLNGQRDSMLTINPFW